MFTSKKLKDIVKKRRMGNRLSDNFWSENERE
jgi:hypothetical protein